MSRGMTKTQIEATRRAALALALTLAPACATAQTTQAPAAQAASDLFLFIYRPGSAWRDGVPMREQGLGPHGAYMQQLLNEGRLFAGGGFVDIDGGMAIVRAANIDEARAVLGADPAISSGIFIADIRHWRPRFRTNVALP